MLKRAEGEKSPADLPVMPYYQLLESGKKLRIKNFSNS
jgi:hypothetical protein